MHAEFTADVAAVRDAVLGGLKPKTQGGRPLTGAGLAALLRLVVEGLNGGQLWDIPSRWASFSDHLRVSSVRAAVSHFQAEVRRDMAEEIVRHRTESAHSNPTPNKNDRWGRASAM